MKRHQAIPKRHGLLGPGGSVLAFVFMLGGGDSLVKNVPKSLGKRLSALRRSGQKGLQIRAIGE